MAKTSDLITTRRKKKPKEMAVITDQCTGCAGAPTCIPLCPVEDCMILIDDPEHGPFGYIWVDPLKCIGCRACAQACPRNIISIVPFKADRMLVVACSNPDAASDVRAVCRVGCLGCRGCARTAPGLVAMDNGGALPTINYDDYDPSDDSIERVIEKCPRKRLLFVGRPTRKDLAAVSDNTLPREIRADFRTTVDETEWRG